MARSRTNEGATQMRSSDEDAYQKVKAIAAICKESKTLAEAQEKSKSISPNENIDALVKAIGHWLK